MEGRTPHFSLDVQGVTGLCPAGEGYAKRQIAARKIPVLSCEGPCVRGEIARRAANLVAKEVPNLARACHGETFFVPHSAMASWVKSADKTIMIDGCFLKCHGRALKGLVGEEKLVQIDALPLHKKYGDLFSMDDVPEEELRPVARQVADEIIARLKLAGEAASAA
ncbi:MAG TPA: putative zinc-binding protein [Anaeromyxobacteraceae bacterium]|nr:putative zinc-binding protein [Anaeromyxobacteraceae bacterium]